MTTQFTMGADDRFRETTTGLREHRHIATYWKIALPVAGALAIIGVAASAMQFANSPDDAPPAIAAPVALSAQKKIAAIADAPVQMVQALPIAKAAEPRSARVEPASSVEQSQIRREPEIVALQDDDPRWGRKTAASGIRGETIPGPIETAELRAKLERLQEPAPEEAAVAASANQAKPTDVTFTGTIPARARIEPAPAAETVGVVQPVPTPRAVPDQPAVAGVETLAAVSALQCEPETIAAEDASKPAAPTRTAKVTKYVNMRAGPENEAAVLTVVPAGRSVNVIDCDMWCEIVFDGRRGWVFKSFIAGS